MSKNLFGKCFKTQYFMDLYLLCMNVNEKMTKEQCDKLACLIPWWYKSGSLCWSMSLTILRVSELTSSPGTCFSTRLLTLLKLILKIATNKMLLLLLLFMQHQQHQTKNNILTPKNTLNRKMRNFTNAERYHFAIICLLMTYIIYTFTGTLQTFSFKLRTVLQMSRIQFVINIRKSTKQTLSLKT